MSSWSSINDLFDAKLASYLSLMVIRSTFAFFGGSSSSTKLSCVARTMADFSLVARPWSKSTSPTSSWDRYHKWALNLSAATLLIWGWISFFVCYKIFYKLQARAVYCARNHAFKYRRATKMQTSLTPCSSFAVSWNCDRKSQIFIVYLTFAIQRAWWTAPGAKKWTPCLGFAT